MTVILWPILEGVFYYLLPTYCIFIQLKVINTDISVIYCHSNILLIFLLTNSDFPQGNHYFPMFKPYICSNQLHPSFCLETWPRSKSIITSHSSGHRICPEKAHDPELWTDKTTGLQLVRENPATTGRDLLTVRLV